MNIKRYLIASFTVAAFAATASAHSVAFEENFDGDYADNFPYILELDHQNPTARVRSLFLDNSGVARPWWHLKDASTSSDRFLASHSCYSPAGTSDDWLGSRAIEIPTKGYTLTFGAQSASLSGDTKLSDLWLFITESPLDANNLPTEPTVIYKDVPVGASEDILEGDFTEYTLSLDEYAGKTIYLNFANLNTDRDLLALDNILVQRLDIAGLSIAAPRYVEQGEYTVDVTVTSTSEEGVSNWKIEFLEDGVRKSEVSGLESIAFGESVTVPVKSNVGKDATVNYSVRILIDGNEPIVTDGVITGLSFLPWHNILAEEATGLWCGNCPGAAYVIEAMTSDEEMREYVIPVSIHIAGAGNDMMVLDEYPTLFGVTAAPAFRFNRSQKVDYVSTVHDTNFDPSNPLSLAAKVKGLHEEITLLEVELDAEFTDTSVRDKIDCTVRVTPAVSLDCSQYGIGFILTENNVGLDNNPFWVQTNYYSGLPYESELGGWTLLPEYVMNARYHDVARGVWGYRGLDGSMPEKLSCDETHSFTYQIEIPETYQEGSFNGIPLVTSPAINPDYLSVIAYVYNKEDYSVINSAVVPMTELTEQKFTVRDLVKANGVESIGNENSSEEPVYYNLQGVRVVNPSAGIYIVRRGNKTSKEIVR